MRISEPSQDQIIELLEEALKKQDALNLELLEALKRIMSSGSPENYSFAQQVIAKSGKV